MYSAISGRATASRNSVSPIPEYRLIFAAVRTTPSPGSSSDPLAFRFALRPCASALAYRFVVATLRNAKRYRLPSMKVVAGPRAASWAADPAAPPTSAAADRPTKDVSTRDRRGPLIHSARQGK